VHEGLVELREVPVGATITITPPELINVAVFPEIDKVAFVCPTVDGELVA
jgi:hypothetical protein